MSQPNKSAENKIIIAIIAICAILYACAITRKDEPSSASSDCYDQAAQDILARDGNRRLNGDDVQRYGNEIASRCK